MAEEYLALQILADERNVIAYRPKLAMYLGSVTAAILLQQIFFRFANHNNEEFYKFRDECDHKLYKAGDSWCEELGFTPKQFDTALGIIGTKIEKGVSKTEAMSHRVDGDVFLPTSLPFLVVYWTDSSRITWYWLNRDLLGKYLKYIYLYKNPEGIYLKRPKRVNTSNSDTTTQTTTETTTDTSLPDGNVTAPDSATSSKSGVNGKEKNTTTKGNELGKASAVQNTPPSSAAPPKNGHFGHYLALLEAYGYEESQITKTEKSNFMSVAVQLHKATFPVDRVTGLYAYVSGKAKAGNWSTWSINSLAKYANEYLKKVPVHIGTISHATTYAPEQSQQETIDERRAQQWQIIYEALESQLDKANFDMWLRDVRLLDFNEDTQAFVVGVRNESAQQFLSYRLNREIDSVLRDVASGLVDIRWTA